MTDKWLKLAQEKFGRQIPITGSGPLAVRLCHRVELCELPMHAQQLVDERCGHHCNHRPAVGYIWHTAMMLVVKQASRERLQNRHLDRIPGEGQDE